MLLPPPANNSPLTFTNEILTMLDVAQHDNNDY